MTVTIAFEDSKYLEAIYGGREMTKAIVAQVEAVKSRLAALDDFATPGAGFNYNAQTGVLRVERDDREIENHVINPPASGYWSGEGFKVRKIGEHAAISFSTRAHHLGRLSAEGMFDWPIYKAALAILMVNGDIDHAALPVPGAFVVPEQRGMADHIAKVIEEAEIDDRDPSERYGSPEHEAWLIEMEAQEG